MLAETSAFQLPSSIVYTDPPSTVSIRFGVVFVRALVPLIGIVIAVAAALAIISANRAGEERRGHAHSELARPAPPPEVDEIEAGDTAPTSQIPESIPEPAAPLPNKGPLAVEEIDLPSLGDLVVVGAKASEPAVIGSLDPTTGHVLRAELTHFGAAIYEIVLAEYRETALGDTPMVIQRVMKSRVKDRSGTFHTVSRYPFAWRSVTVNGALVPLETTAWRRVAGAKDGINTTAAFEVDIAIADDTTNRVCTLRRTYTLEPGRFDIKVEHAVANHSEGPIQVVLATSAQTDMPQRAVTYMGDRRELAAGYFNPTYDTTRTHIFTDNAKMARSKVVEGPWPGTAAPLWPNEDLPLGTELVWIASINRYFTVVAHPTVDRDGPLPSLEHDFPHLGVDKHGSKGQEQDLRVLMFHLRSRPLTLAAGQAETIAFGAYAGPRSRDVFEADPLGSLQFASHLIVYSLGGPCTFCTFQWLARGLLGFMTGIHFLFRDWGLAIIILVLIVRFLLHPITKRSQIQMSKFQKQIAAMQPEIEKLKKKYGDNQQKIQQEQMKLFRERGINPMNMLGCLPMFLQMPIWIALYAMLFLAIELRHEPAFYGIFQWLGEAVAGAPWGFLADLSEPDQFIKFADGGFNLPLCNVYIPYTLNILPILMAVFFFFQTKLTATPPANEQARQQQRMMTIMMVTIFPIMLYPAPCGLTLYIMSSTLAGMVDSLVVRRHIRRMEAEGTLYTAKKPRAGGWMERMQKAVEKQQRRRSGGSG